MTPLPVVEPVPAVAAGRRRGFSGWAIALIAAALIYLGWAGERLIRTLAITADEPIYVGAGLSYWKNGDYRISTGNSFFTQKWATLPLAFDAEKFPSPAAQAALHNDAGFVGTTYLFSDPRDPRELMRPARRMTLLLCFATAALVGAWAFALAGPWATAFAVLFYATAPTTLANGVLATTDTGVTLWFLAALFSYDRFLRRPRPAIALACGGSLGLMLLSKFLLPAWLAGAALLLAWRLWSEPRSTSALRLAAWHIVVALAAALTIWAFFGWTFAPGGVIREPPAAPGWLQHAIDALLRARVLPAPFLQEFLELPAMLEPRPSYLFGEFKLGGHVLYFPVAFLAKSALAVLAALVLGFGLRRRNAKTKTAGLPRALAPLLAGAAGYLLLSLGSPVNVGARHILPLFVLAEIAAGAVLAQVACEFRRGRYLAAALALVATMESWSAHARPLAWFNLAAGGPMHGYRLMVDSSLEWGGDLPDIAAWQEKHPGETPTYLCALGPPGYQRYGVRALPLVGAFLRGDVRPGRFIFSATRLVGGVESAYGAWTDAKQRAWDDAGAHAWRKPLPVELAGLAASRLAAACRAREPDERIGPVYFVYRLDAAALAAALGPGE